VTINDLKKEIVNLFENDNEFVTSVTNVLNKTYYTKQQIDTKFTEITNEIDYIKEDLKKLITSIEIDGVFNPVIGYLNLPLDVKSNILFTYFGKSDFDFTFPAAGGKWVKEEEKFSGDEIMVMTGGQTNFSSIPGGVEEYGDEYFANDNGDGKVNMGTVYVTINPTNVNFAGNTLTLQNTAGKQSKVELLPLKKSSATLTFGYDRTRGNETGFYAADAVMDITKANIDDIRLSLDVKGLLQSAKSAFKNRSKNDLATLAYDFYKSIDNKLDANAVKATWTDNTVGERSVISRHDIGTTAVKPMSFNSLTSIDALYKGLPGRDRIYKIIDKVIQQIEVESPVPTTNDSIHFQKWEIKSGSSTILVVTYETWINGVYRTDTASINLDDSEASDVRKLIEVLAEATEGSAEILAELINELNTVDARWDEVFQDAKDNMVKYLMQYVDKAYKKANNYYHLYTLFDLTMVAHQAGKGFRFVGHTKKRATKVEGTVALYPTSNTAEYFAPAYKKLIGISNVYDAAGNPLDQATAIAKAKAAAGENMNTVISGDARVTITGEAGYIYQISYFAVDYQGYKSRKKFYVKF
jgi:hypothetical protein